MSKAKEDLGGKSDKRPPSSMSTGSADSGVQSNSVASSGNHSGPPSPTAQLNSLIFQTANLIAVNEQLRKEIAENKQIQTIQMRALNRLSSSPDQTQPFVSHQNYSPNQRGGRERRVQKPESYKTVICQAWLESKTCTFAENCRFAHGEEELRPSKIEPRQNNKYKTKLCDKYTTTGLCPYGKRCLFIHPDHGPNAYIRADKLFEVSQRHAMADLRDQMETQIMTGGRKTSQLAPEIPFSSRSAQMETKKQTRSPHCEASTRPHPSWPLESSFSFSSDSFITNNSFEPVFSGSNQPYFMTGQQTISEPSPLSPFPNTSLPAVRFQPEEDCLSSIPGFDHLAEDMAKHLELW